MIVPQPEEAYHRFMRLWYAGDRSLPKMVDRLCSYIAWVDRGLCNIRDQSSAIVPLKHNRIQRTLLGVALIQAACSKPIRIVTLKARKGGSSTLWQTLKVFLCAHYDNQVALMLAHVPDSTREIFHIAKTAIQGYSEDVVVLDMTLRFPQTHSRYTCHTAGGLNVGAGGTPSMLHLSEVALYERNKIETLTSALKSVPNDPCSIIVLESTARGREEFFNLFEDARSDSSHPYASIFVPWFLDDRLTMRAPRGFAMDEQERTLHRLASNEYGIELTPDAMTWRRQEIKSTIGGEAFFRQEYPSTPEEAVQASGDVILPGMRQCLVDGIPFDADTLPYDQLVGGIDYGYHDATAIITGVYRDQVLYIIDVYRASEALAADHVPHTWDGHTYWCDPSELDGRREMMKLLREQNRPVKILPAPRRKQGRGTGFVNAEWSMVLRMLVEDRLKIYRPVSGQLILEADNLNWSPTTGKPDMKRSVECGHFDTLDALRYCVMGIEHKPITESCVRSHTPTINRRMEFRI